MSDTLEIFGTEYQNVAGFKATDDNSQTKTYIRPQGTKSISANGTGIDVTAYAAVDVSVSGGSPNLQSKTKSYTPTETAQSETVSADTGYDGLDEVSISVGAIDSEYVGSDIPRNDYTDLTVSGNTVIAPAGYYAQMAGAQVASGSATPAASISATGATVSTGTNTLTLSKTVSNTPQVSAGYVSSGTAGNSSVSLTASVTTKAATTYRAGTSQQTIASGTYLTGTQTIAAVSQTNLSAENIKSGTTISISNGDTDIWSVIGTYTGSGGVTLLGSKEFTVSTTSTSQTSVGSIAISPSTAVWTTDAIIYVKIRDKAGPRNGYFFGSDNFFMNYNLASGVTNQNVQLCGRLIYYYDSSNVYKPNTGGYGVYAYQILYSTGHNIEIYRRYNSNYTKTINGTFKAEVYSIPISKLFGSQT